MRHPIDWALLFLRVTSSLLLLQLHGLPKLLQFSEELQRIEDPFGLGAGPTLVLAIFAEVFCPLLILLGLGTRLACVPILVLLLVSLLLVHPQWSLAEGQFAWLLLIIFSTLAISGGGRITANRRFFGAQGKLLWIH